MDVCMCVCVCVHVCLTAGIFAQLNDFRACVGLGTSFL